LALAQVLLRQAQLLTLLLQPSPLFGCLRKGAFRSLHPTNRISLRISGLPYLANGFT